MRFKCFIFLLLSHMLHAQFEVKGKVIDQNGNPLPYVNILLLEDENESMIKGEITDDSGNFIIKNIRSDNYILKISFIGFQELVKSININKNIHLETLMLNEEVENLEEVVITSKKPIFQQKVDRLVVNVKGTLVAESGTAIDVLQRLPGLNVSSDGNTLTLNGKEEVGILLNGRLTRVPIESLLQMLSSTNAKDIDSIEIISNPPSKYDAEFTGGLINIKQGKKQSIGTNGSIMAGIGYGRSDKERFGFNFNHRKSNINFYGNFNFNRNNSPRTLNNVTRLTSDANPLSSSTKSSRKPIITGYAGALGFDYYLSEKIILGLLVNGNTSLFKQEVSATNFFNENNQTVVTNILNNENSVRDLIITNFNTTIQMDDTQNLNFDIDYLNYYSENPTDYNNVYRNSDDEIIFNEFVTASKETPVDIWIGKFDYTKDLEKFQLEFGGKYTNSFLKNGVDVKDLVNNNLIINEELSEKSTLKEHIIAAYSSVNLTINDNTKLNIGLRFESSSQDLKLENQGTVLDNRLNEFFPSLFLSKKIKEHHEIQFSYGRRITRPTYFDLAPFLLFLDPNTFFNGNIELKPSFSNSVLLNYKYKKYLLGLNYTRTTNGMARVQPVFLEDTNQQVLTTLNIDQINTFSVNISAPIKINDWWNIRNNVETSFQNQKNDGENRNDFYYVIKSSQNFQLTETMKMELFALYNSNRVSGVREIHDFQRVNLIAEKNIESWNSKIQFGFNNIFGKKFGFESLDNDFYSRVNYDFEPRVVTVTFTYNFGNSKIKKQRKREMGSSEIKKRIK
ncbi:outer membrane beta-barrel protein [Tenacibaculum sp. C7A-26P2]|uniref:outer membrane beta-barrel protein n=1 Tax=Tenacibaculum sp. C7A-26P2 TaxID=3447504 RepID=UPI003F8358C0